MSNIQNHKELKVWQDALDAAMEIFHITKTFPQKKNIHWSIRYADHRGRWPQIFLKHGENDVMKPLLKVS
jgi:hypothetical protein